MPISIEVLQMMPVIVAAFAVGVVDMPSPSRTIFVGCVAIISSTLAHMVRRLEQAREDTARMLRRGGQEQAPPNGHAPQDSNAMMRAAARWGSDVLNSIAGGASGEFAVWSALPRINGNGRAAGNSSYAPSEAGSESELYGLGDGTDWVMNAARSVSTTPIGSERLEGARAQAVQNAVHMATVPEEGTPALSFGQLVRVPSSRPSGSPLRRHF